MATSEERKYWQKELRNGENLGTFAETLKTLTNKDKADLDEYARAEIAAQPTEG